MLTAELVPPVDDLRLEVPAEPGSIARVRSAMAEWLDGLQPRELDRQAVLHATSELVANAVQHAYPSSPHPGTLLVEACLSEHGQVEVMVGDRGRWQGQGNPEGRGLAIVGGLVDRMGVVRGTPATGGTTVTLEHDVSRDAQLLRTPVGEPTRPTPVEVPARIEASLGRLSATGPLDWDNSDELRAALLAASRGGMHPATIDLSEVTHLASAAVLALFEARNRAARHGVELVLVAPVGTPAQHVLEVVGVPYVRTADPLTD
jgi:anti-sigma regulatory factor (Ser/Thr protein kinase)/anti-anti-sigma regulatory factor